MENRPCQMNLISFFAVITGLLDEVSGVDCKKKKKRFSKAFSLGPHTTWT